MRIQREDSLSRRLKYNTIFYDILIIGSGIAGLAAISAASEDNNLRIAVISNVQVMRSHYVSAEGGTAAVIQKEGNIESHIYDTIKGSDFLADQDVADDPVHAVAPKRQLQEALLVRQAFRLLPQDPIIHGSRLAQ